MSAPPRSAPPHSALSASAQSAVLECRSLHFHWGVQPVLSDLDLHVARGELYALLGGNGAGKSTTLKLILGLLAPASGSIRVDGIDAVHDTAAARRRLAYVPENVALYESLSARENLDYFLGLTGDRPDAGVREQALDAVGLAGSARDQRTAAFSKGMRQKVAIALALARDVPLLLLDEPTTGLDPRAIDEFNTLLRGLRDRNTALLMVTHDLLGAGTLANRVGFLLEGRICEECAGGDDADLMQLHRHYLSHQRTVDLHGQRNTHALLHTPNHHDSRVA